jgi:hypothetical protein
MNRSRLVFIAVVMASLASVAWGRTWIDARGREVSGAWTGGAAGAVAAFVGLLFFLARLAASRQ